jgi:hypothetical protein
VRWWSPATDSTTRRHRPDVADFAAPVVVIVAVVVVAGLRVERSDA